MIDFVLSLQYVKGTTSIEVSKATSNNLLHQAMKGLAYLHSIGIGTETRELSGWGKRESRELSGWGQRESRELSGWGQRESRELSGWGKRESRELSGLGKRACSVYQRSSQKETAVLENAGGPIVA